MTALTFTAVHPDRANPDTMRGRVGVVHPDRTSGLAALSGQHVVVRATGRSAFHGTPLYEVSGVAVSGSLAGRAITAVATARDFQLLPAPLYVRECTTLLCEHEVGPVARLRACWTVHRDGTEVHGFDGLAAALVEVSR